MTQENILTFGDLDLWDIFETETAEYYLKIEEVNEFNAIYLSGDAVEYSYFSDREPVKKIK